ncbi:MAG: heavy-metal-associated domain-containing protein [Gammaproteobacteria bacterium]
MDLEIEGMHCEGCAQIIQSVLARLEGVQTSAVSHRDGAARVLFDPARVTREQIEHTIDKAGYHVEADA